MKNPISPRNLQLLSDYLDRQLNPRQQAYMENRLRQEPDLQQAFSELRHTQQLLRGLPQKKAPRNFLLAHEMALAPRPPWIAPSLGFASALATFLLICVFVLQGTGFLGSQTASVQPSQEEIALEVEKILMATLSQEEAMKALAFPTGTPEPMAKVSAAEQPVEGEMAEAAPESLQADTPLAAVSLGQGLMPPATQAAGEADLTVEGDLPPAPAADLPSFEMRPLEESTAAAQDVNVLRAMTQTQPMTVGIEGPPPELYSELEETQPAEKVAVPYATEVANLLPTALDEASEDTAYTPSHPKPPTPWLLILKIGLASLALLTGGLALLLSRRK